MDMLLDTKIAMHIYGIANYYIYKLAYDILFTGARAFPIVLAVFFTQFPERSKDTVHSVKLLPFNCYD
jgi:hypothetical protein